MTMWSRIFALFPLCHMAIILGSIYYFVLCPSFFAPALVFSAIYLFPLLCFRVLNFITPIEEGVSDILNDRFSPWWASHQIQTLFIAVPSLEAILKIIPGAFSLWLRMWGSKVGRGIYWTPGSCHYDRNLLEIEDGVIFGERSTTVCHVITPKDGKGLLRIKKIKIGKRAFIGAGSVLSPGVEVDEAVMIRAGSEIYPMRRVTKDGEVKIND
ncbi:acyltransferase [Halobacteriovorax marinus]|nr:acyltransferase [Halobacteriovorax marinus]